MHIPNPSQRQSKASTTAHWRAGFGAWVLLVVLLAGCQSVVLTEPVAPPAEAPPPPPPEPPPPEPEITPPEPPPPPPPPPPPRLRLQLRSLRHCPNSALRHQHHSLTAATRPSTSTARTRPVSTKVACRPSLHQSRLSTCTSTPWARS